MVCSRIESKLVKMENVLNNWDLLLAQQELKSNIAYKFCRIESLIKHGDLTASQGMESLQIHQTKLADLKGRFSVLLLDTANSLSQNADRQKKFDGFRQIREVAEQASFFCDSDNCRLALDKCNQYFDEREMVNKLTQGACFLM